MPVLERDGAQIHYDVYGDGYPLILFAPGGMHSVAQMWRERPGAPGQPMPWIDPTTELSNQFQVVAMDQRNAGRSKAPISAADGWPTYTADHLALIDQLGFDQVHVMGGCIGSSYCLGLCQAAPERVTAAVLQNPIGLSADNRGNFFGMFDSWAGELQANRAEVDAPSLAAFRQSMFGGDFVFSVGRDFVHACTTPLLVLAGNDEFHPLSGRPGNRRSGPRRRPRCRLDQSSAPRRDALARQGLSHRPHAEPGLSPAFRRAPRWLAHRGLRTRPAARPVAAARPYLVGPGPETVEQGSVNNCRRKPSSPDGDMPSIPWLADRPDPFRQASAGGACTIAAPTSFEQAVRAQALSGCDRRRSRPLHGVGHLVADEGGEVRGVGHGDVTVVPIHQQIVHHG